MALLRALAFCKAEILDAAKPNEIVTSQISEECAVLHPAKIYFGAKNARAGSKFYVPEISGKSSTGRLGIQVHCTSLGDVGFEQWWTLEKSDADDIKNVQKFHFKIIFLNIEDDKTEKLCL